MIFVKDAWKHFWIRIESYYLGGKPRTSDRSSDRRAVDLARIQTALDRRRPGQSHLTTQRKEADQLIVLSGIESGRTLGTTIAFQVENLDARPRDYNRLKTVYRPSHADMTYDFKYGLRPLSGGGRASARETVSRVAAGSLSEQWLEAEP